MTNASLSDYAPHLKDCQFGVSPVNYSDSVELSKKSGCQKKKNRLCFVFITLYILSVEIALYVYNASYMRLLCS